VDDRFGVARVAAARFGNFGIFDGAIVGQAYPEGSSNEIVVPSEPLSARIRPP
jgi:hypothetical protein